MIMHGKYFAIVSVYHAEVLCSKQVYINDVGTKVAMDRRWHPTQYTWICSEHFVFGEKTE